MAIEITENWRERDYQKGRGATRVFVITGVDDEEEARAALAAGQAPIEPITLNTEHPLDSRLKALEPRIRLKAPLSRAYEANVQYTRPDNGDHSNDPDDPLDQDPVIFPDLVSETEQFDVDANGNPIVTAAANPFDVNPTRDTGPILLTYTRNESSYDLAKALAYRNKTNSDSYSFPHVGSVSAGQALCKGIRLAQGYSPSSSYVTVVYTFELREEGFRTRLLNHDYTGWYDDDGTPKRGKFVSATGMDLGRPVLLTVTGVPIDSSVKVLTASGAVADPIDTPEDMAAFMYEVGYTGGALFETTAAPATFMKYPKYGEISFNGLDL